MTDTEGMAAQPPGPTEPPRVVFHMPEPPTVTELAWRFTNAVLLTIICLAVAAYFVMTGWNGLVDLTHLPEINWRETFTGLVLLRILALVARV